MVMVTLLLVTKMVTYGDISDVATDDSSLSFHRRADFRMDSTQYYILKKTTHKYRYLKKGLLICGSYLQSTGHVSRGKQFIYISQEIYCLGFCLTGNQTINQIHIFLFRVSETRSRALFRSPLPYSVKASLLRRRPTMAASRCFTNATHLRIRDISGFRRVIRTNDRITRRKTQFSTDLTIRGYQPPGS